MIKTLGDLYNYTNEKLLDGELSEVRDVIEYYEECQQIIATLYPIEAPKTTLTLTSNVITKPDDFMSLRKIVLASDTYRTINPVDMWANEIILPEHLLDNEHNLQVELYYYKKPTMLDADNLAQVPDIDQRYLPSIGKYAATLYKLADDDDEAKKAFRESFENSLQLLGNLNTNHKRFNYSNVW